MHLKGCIGDVNAIPRYPLRIGYGTRVVFYKTLHSSHLRFPCFLRCSLMIHFHSPTFCHWYCLFKHSFCDSFIHLVFHSLCCSYWISLSSAMQMRWHAFCIAVGVVEIEKPDVLWSQLDGLKETKDDLQQLVTFPIKFPQLFKGR